MKVLVAIIVPPLLEHLRMFFLPGIQVNDGSTRGLGSSCPYPSPGGAVDTQRTRTQTVELDGGRQATFRVFGSGPPMFFFVGGPGLPAMLQLADAEILQERFDVYLIDPHGSGGSSPPADPSAYDHFGHARFYDEVRRALGLERVSIAGESFGGVTALTYSAMYPEVVERCIAVSALALGEDVAGEDSAEQAERGLSRHAGAP
jgi:pimeloyl-ACP methyl ester carboxylesterase